MAYPCLAFCPYLSVNKVIAFADWEIGPLNAFDEARWVDQKFRAQSAAFLGKFVTGSGEPTENPSIVCRRGARIDGAPPTTQEMEALESALAFSFLDKNPRNTPATRGRSWAVLTSDNTELFVWPIDVEEGEVVVTTGLMVRMKGTGYRIADRELIIRPPIDLQAPLGKFTADALCLEAVYKTVLQSAAAPGTNLAADRLRVAIGWFMKAWRNTATLHFPERLEQWFMAFAGTRNQVIHEGTVPSLEYKGSNPAYDGHFVFTAEFLLRAVVKVSLAPFGYPDLWRTGSWRAVKAACEEFERQAQSATPPDAVSTS